MDKYEKEAQLGQGTYGTVRRYRHLRTGELVAIKKMRGRFETWRDCVALAEVKALKYLRHKNIVKLKEVIREEQRLYLVFEYMQENLHEVITRRTEAQSPFPESTIRSMMYQALSGLAHLHQHDVFHRDLKPENLLVTGEVLKIGDFGLARSVVTGPPYTEYISSRWYRAPEVLLKNGVYGPAIDMWAIGTIMAEMYGLAPLFAGENEIDQLRQIARFLGPPTEDVWPDGLRFAAILPGGVDHRPVMEKLADALPQASLEALQLLHDLLQYNPNKRPSATEALHYPFFQSALR
ncbi:serine/threonine-protein kinase MHK isoform X1 [Balamuthia mandrillaris]